MRRGINRVGRLPRLIVGRRVGKGEQRLLTREQLKSFLALQVDRGAAAVE